MKYTISEASRIVGVTRKTLYNHIEKKPISTETDDNGKPLIEASELIRVYGDKCKFDRANPNEETPKTTHVSATVPNDLKYELALVKQENGFLKTQIEQYESRVTYLEDALKQSQTVNNRTTMLLEDKSNSGGLKETVERLEEQNNSFKSQIDKMVSKSKNQISRYQSLIDEQFIQLEGQGTNIDSLKNRHSELSKLPLANTVDELETKLKSYRSLYKQLRNISDNGNSSFKKKWLPFGSQKPSPISKKA